EPEAARASYQVQVAKSSQVHDCGSLSLHQSGRSYQGLEPRFSAYSQRPPWWTKRSFHFNKRSTRHSASGPCRWRMTTSLTAVPSLPLTVMIALVHSNLL